MGRHLRTLFLLAASIYAASKTEFANNSLKSPKIGKLNIDTLIIPQGLLIHEKTQTIKGHATVPLMIKGDSVARFFGLRFFLPTVASSGPTYGSLLQFQILGGMKGGISFLN